MTSLPLATLGAYGGTVRQETTSNLKQLGHPALTAVFAAILRGLILNAPIIPIFAMILSATSALGMVVWRRIFVFLNRKVR